MVKNIYSNILGCAPPIDGEYLEIKRTLIFWASGCFRGMK